MKTKLLILFLVFSIYCFSQQKYKKINNLSTQILGIREVIREESGIIEMKEKERIIEDKTNKKSIHIGNGLYVEIE